MRVLVTGGAGFIGSHVVDALVACGHETIVLDNLDPQVHGPGATAPRLLLHHESTAAISFRRGDVCDPGSVREALRGVQAVVHLAAAVGVGQSMYEPVYYIRNNDLATGVLLQEILSRRRDVRRLVVASSMSLYGEGSYRCTSCPGGEPRPRSETQLAAKRFEVECSSCGAEMEPAPTPETKTPDLCSIYAATKKHQEDLFLTFGRAYRIPTFALRFFNTFGQRQSLANAYTGVAAIFLSRLLSGKPPLVFEDGRQSRDFVDVRDVAQAVLLAIDSEAEGAHALNIGTGERITISGVAATLARELGVDITPQLLGRVRVGDIRHCYADPSLAERILGFKACYRLATGVGSLVKWCRGERTADRVEDSLRELSREDLVR